MASESNTSTGTKIVRIVTALVVLIAAVGVVMGLAALRKPPHIDRPIVLAPTVAVKKLTKEDIKIRIALNGTVEAITQSQIVSQVAGRVARVTENVFIAGGVVKEEGAKVVLLEIDDADYRSSKAMAEAEVARVEAQILQLGALKSQADVAVSSARLAKGQAEASVKVEEAGIQRAKSALVQAERAIVQAQAAVDLEASQREIAIAEWLKYAAGKGVDADKVPAIVGREPQRKDVEARLASAVAGKQAAAAGVKSASEMKNRALAGVDVAQGGIESAQEQVTVAEANIKVAQEGLKAAKVSLEMAELNLSRCTIYAPYSGYLTETKVNVGQFVAPGQVLAQIVSLQIVQARLPVAKDQITFLGLEIDPETRAVKPLSLQLTTTIGGQEQVVAATITRVSPMVNSRTRAFELFAEIDNSKAFENIADLQAGVRAFPVLPGAFVTAVVSGRELQDVFEFPRSGLRSSAPKSVLEHYPHAEWFIAITRQDKSQVQFIEKPDDPNASQGETAGDQPATPLADDRWVTRYIEFIPVRLVRKQGENVMVRAFAENGPALDDLEVISSALEFMSQGMKVRVAASGADGSPAKSAE